MKKIIDGDNMCLIEYFQEKDTKFILEVYQDDIRWEDVAIDADGDIICFREL